MIKNKIFLTFLMLVIVLATACNKKSTQQKIGNSISIKDFRSGKNDHTLAFKAAFDALLNKGGKELHIPKGKYYISAPVVKNATVNHDIKIIGEPGTTIICKGDFIWLSAGFDKDKKLQKDIKRGAKEVYLNSTKGIQIGDILILNSNKEGEKGWRYKKSENHRVKNIIKDGLVVLETTVNFPYELLKEKVRVTSYRRKNITLENLNFEFSESSKSKFGIGLRFDGFSIMGQKLSFKSKLKEQKGSLVHFVNCNNVDISDVYMEGVTYGLLFGNSRNINIKNTTANNCMHPFVPATWSSDLTFDKLRGKDIVIDAHPSFDVWYNDVDIDMGDNYFNCRALGVKLTNCKFKAGKKANSPSIGIGMTTLPKEYRFLLREYDVILKNVEWLHTLNQRNGLVIHSARKFLIENCKTHGVATGHFCGEILIKNSSIGMFQCYDNNFTLKNVIFDGSLQRVDKPKFAISTSFSGKALIEDCTFKNYDKDYSSFFNYIHSPDSEIVFKNCKISNFKNWVGKLGYEKKDYTGLVFDNCTIENIKEKIPQQFTRGKMKLNNTKLKNVKE